MLTEFKYEKWIITMIEQSKHKTIILNRNDLI